MVRVGQVIKVVPDKIEEYKRLHAAVWPGVLAMIRECNIRNFSIFLRDGYLFSYYEYVGDSYEKDMAKMAEDPETRRWWTFTDPCQRPVDSAGEGARWADMEEVFHCD
jgi:L-rhamnose mutarotase